jgi:hypothetical protein
MNAILELNARGTLTIPKAMRHLLGLDHGGRVIAETSEQGILLRPGVAVVVAPLVGLTVAVAGVPLTQLNVFPLMTLALASRAEAVKTCVGPAAVSVAVLGTTATTAVTCPTVRLALPLIPSTLAVIALVPFATAVAVVAVAPLVGLTVATPMSVLTQPNVFPLITLPLASRASAVNTRVAPTEFSTAGLGVTPTVAVAPGVTVIVGSVPVTVVPLIVAETVFTSAVVELSVPVATPLAFVVPGCAKVLLLPVAPRTTAMLGIALPNWSRAVTVIWEPVPPATIDAGSATTVDSASFTDAGRRVAMKFAA